MESPYLHKQIKYIDIKFFFIFIRKKKKREKKKEKRRKEKRRKEKKKKRKKEKRKKKKIKKKKRKKKKEEKKKGRFKRKPTVSFIYRKRIIIVDLRLLNCNGRFPFFKSYTNFACFTSSYPVLKSVTLTKSVFSSML